MACAIGELMVRIGTADQKNYVIEMWRYANLLKQRSSNPAIGHEHQSNTKAMLQGVEISINELGMRGPSLMPPESVRKRVVILGDSSALGWGVPEKSSLRGQLSSLAGPEIEVLNNGVGNMNLSQIVSLWEKQSRSIHADTVLLLASPRAPEIQHPDDTNWLVQHSMLAAMFVTFSRQMSSGTGGREMLVNAYREAWTSGPGADAMQDALNRLAALQKEQGSRVIVAQLPESHDFNNYQFGFMAEIMGRESAIRGWEFVDLQPLFKGPPTGSYWVSANDIHLNAEATHLIAERLFPLLRM